MDDLKLKPTYCPREYAEPQSWVGVLVYAGVVLCCAFLFCADGADAPYTSPSL
jgi:hypothetical protein